MADSNRSDSRVMVVNPGRPIVRETFRFSSWIGAPHAQPPLMQEVVQLIMKWVQEKHHEPLPEIALNGGTCEESESSSQFAIMHYGDAWALRLRQPDTPYRETPAVPGRLWTTHIALKRSEPGLRLGVIVECSSQPYANPAAAHTRPRIIIDLADRFGLTDDIQLVRTPTWINNEQELNMLHEWMLHPERRKSIVVATGLDEDQQELSINGFSVDIDDFAQRLYCLAHLVALPGPLARQWSERVGKDWGVFRGGVREYRPGVDFESQEPYEHPLMIAARIRQWRWGHDEGPTAFTRFVTERCIEASLSRIETEGLMFYSQLRVEASRMAPGAPESTEEQLNLTQEQLHATEQRLKEVTELADRAMDDELMHRREVERLRDEVFRLRQRNDVLQAAIEQGALPDPAPVPRPDAYEEIAEWCRNQWTGRMVLHPRAIRGLKTARYQRIGLVIDALDLLASHFCDMGRGIPGAKEKFDARCQELGVELERSMTPSRRGEVESDYEVVFPPNIGRPRVLEWHLKKGVSRDPAECLRLYFFYDDETQQVVVGWLPSHLATRAT